MVDMCREKKTCVVLWLDERDFPENLHIVRPCHNK